MHESDHDHVDTLGAMNELKIKISNELLASQVQAFFEGSEDVDIDANTIKDILQAILVDKEDVEDAGTRSDTQMNNYEDSDGEFEVSSQELDISPLFERNHEGIFFFLFSLSVPLLSMTSDGDMVKARGQANALPSQRAWLVFFSLKSPWARRTRVCLF